MRIASAVLVSASLLVAACGGGQTEPTEAEEALANDLQPAAPSATVVPSGGEGNQMNGSSTAAPGGNSQ